MQEFKRKHGHCRVPKSFVASGNVKLGAWVNKQRTQYRRLKEGKNSQITQERIDLLESIGIEWSVRESWHFYHQLLQELRKMYGHCPVPKSFVTSGNVKLGVWL